MCIVVALVILIPFSGFSQSPGADSLPKVIQSMREFRKSVHTPGMQMVDLGKFIPGLLLDLRYATDNNFLGRKLYPRVHTTYLRREAAEALAHAQQQLKQQGLALKVWDAYRPYSVTEAMWAAVPDERYAANPKFGSGHNRGIAIDVTVVRLADSSELDMGTGFDNFSDTAHVNFTNLPPQTRANRKLLQEAMEAAGFVVLTTEWWHFYLPDSKRYPLLGLSFPNMHKVAN